MKEENTKKFDIISVSEQNAVKAGNDVTVVNTAPMVKDSSIT